MKRRRNTNIEESTEWTKRLFADVPLVECHGGYRPDVPVHYTPAVWAAEHANNGIDVGGFMPGGIYDASAESRRRQAGRQDAC